MTFKLTRFRVTEFRSVLDSGSIDVDGVTALIGTNESGKTNLLLLRGKQLIGSNIPNIVVVVHTRTLQEFIRSGAHNYGIAAGKIVTFRKLATDLLFRDLWLRPALAPRDRSLVTVSALIASGQVAQITYHLGRAMDNGLTQPQASELLTHIAFYAGWPCAFSALPIVKDVFEKRQKQ